jgi:hypothetical protein
MVVAVAAAVAAALAAARVLLSSFPTTTLLLRFPAPALPVLMSWSIAPSTIELRLCCWIPVRRVAEYFFSNISDSTKAARLSSSSVSASSE